MWNEVTHAAFTKVTTWQRALENPDFPSDRRPQVVNALSQFLEAMGPLQRAEMALDMILVTVDERTPIRGDAG